jgi:hypothetical protein
MAAPKPTPIKIAAAPVAEVTPEVTVTETHLIAEPRPITGVAPRPLFQTTTEDAPQKPNVAPAVRKLTAKTLAEHAAGKEAISQYAPAE